MAKKKTTRLRSTARKKATPSKRAAPKKKAAMKMPVKPATKATGKATAKPRRKAKRKPGRPKDQERVFLPADLEELRLLWIDGATGATLARHFGCSRTTIHHHLRTVCKECRDNSEDTADCEVERIRALQVFAWKNIRENDGEETHITIKEKILGNGIGEAVMADRVIKKIRHDRVVNWVGVVQWCISEVNRIRGHYNTRAQVEAKEEFRVAGQTREQITAKAAKRFAEYVEKARRGEI